MRPDDGGVIDDYLPIGEFARRTGLTPSALRFYADTGVLPPAHIDAESGYRYNPPDQADRAVLLRRLRETGMSLPVCTAALTGGPAETTRLLAEHSAVADAEARRRARIAAELLGSLAPHRTTGTATVRGPAFASAVDQVLTATGDDPTHPILRAVHLEAGPDQVTLTATDRYRLSTRTLVTIGTGEQADWSAALEPADLLTALPEIRRRPRIAIFRDDDAVWVRSPDQPAHRIAAIDETFPDHRSMVAGLPEPATRLVTPQNRLLEALERITGPVCLRILGDLVTVGEGGEEPTAAIGLAGSSVTGAAVTIWFDHATLYPAISTAVGGDLLLDLRGPELPVTVRSADDGALTTVLMPIAAPSPGHTR
ncbi:MerR family transcriptional regulator [Gordonia sp. FQ]|uniref:DNA polymerase III subunit beta family protein n=1 Tax=Gordonia sp. FQ TaxID=3446634 RepID=UPI003F87ACCB